MAQAIEHRSIDDAVELLKENGFEGLAEAVTVLMNTPMITERSEYLGLRPTSAAPPGLATPAASKTKP